MNMDRLGKTAAVLLCQKKWWKAVAPKASGLFAMYLLCMVDGEWHTICNQNVIEG